MTQILVIVVLTLVNGIFAMSETALISINENKVKVKAEQGDKKSIILSRLLSDSNKFLSTIQIGITLAGYLSAAFASDAFAGDVAQWLHSWSNVSLSILNPISTVVVTLILSYFSIVLGEMVPKRLAIRDSEKISYSVSGLINGMSKVTGPFVSFLSISTNAVVRLLGFDPNEDDSNVTEEEIRLMTDVAQEKGAIRENEKNMIFNIFNFDNTPVSDIMTHRTEVLALDVLSGYEEVKHFVFDGRFSRYPVYEESIDNIIGVIHLRDLLRYDRKNLDEATFNLKNIMRKAYYVPDSIYADELFFDLQTKNIHMAVVVDEYGGTAGVVSVEDLLEEIVGDIFDEYDEAEDEEILEISDDSYIVDGDVPLDRIEELLYNDLPLNDFDTLSGFIIGLLGRLPQPNDRQKFQYNGYEFEILEADNRVVYKVGIQKLPEEEDSSEE